MTSDAAAGAAAARSLVAELLRGLPSRKVVTG